MNVLRAGRAQLWQLVRAHNGQPPAYEETWMRVDRERGAYTLEWIGGWARLAMLRDRPVLITPELTVVLEPAELRERRMMRRGTDYVGEIAAEVPEAVRGGGMGILRAVCGDLLAGAGCLFEAIKNPGGSGDYQPGLSQKAHTRTSVV